MVPPSGRGDECYWGRCGGGRALDKELAAAAWGAGRNVLRPYGLTRTYPSQPSGERE